MVGQGVGFQPKCKLLANVGPISITSLLVIDGLLRNPSPGSKRRNFEYENQVSSFNSVSYRGNAFSQLILGA